MSLLQKVKWETQTGTGRWSTSTFETPVGVLPWTCRRKMKGPSRYTGGQSSPHQWLAYLKCWEAWDTTCRHKAKDITPPIAWRREAWKEEALDDLPWKDERGPSSIRRNIGTVSKATLGELLREARMGFSELIDTTLDWTEQSSPQNTCTCNRQTIFYIFISSNFLTTLQRHWYKCTSHFPNI